MLNAISKKAGLYLLKKYIKPHKNKFIGLYLITMISYIMGLLPIYFMGIIINYVTAKSFEKILQTIIILCLLFLGSSVFNIGQTYLSSWLSNQITKTIKDDIYSKATNIALEEFQKITPGHIISLIEGDSAKLADFYVTKIIGVLVSLVTLVVSLFFLFKLSIPLTLIAIIAFPLGFLGNVFCGKKMNMKSELLRKISDQNYTFLNGTLNGIKEVKSYVIEHKMVNKFKFYTTQIQKNNMSLSVLELISNMFNVLVSSIADWLIIGYGTWKIINGTFSIGAYVAFNGFLGTFFNAVKELLNVNVTFRTIETSFRRINDFLGIEDEKTNRRKKIESFTDDIIFDKVSFSYAEGSGKVLDEFSAVFKKQQMSVIVGINGIGKSTILALIEQFYQPQEGNIFIGNDNLKDVDLECLRNNIGMVQQHPLILSGTLRENLIYGNECVGNDILDQVCSMVGLTDFVNNLQNGYDTYLSEISGGQQQRIAIARALIKNPSILLLDEITSDLDGKSENEIIKLLMHLADEKTVILISHRANAIVGIPNIYVMDQGKIISQGNHRDLSEGCLLYSLLVNSKE